VYVCVCMTEVECSWGWSIDVRPSYLLYFVLRMCVITSRCKPEQQQKRTEVGWLARPRLAMKDKSSSETLPYKVRQSRGLSRTHADVVKEVRSLLYL